MKKQLLIVASALTLSGVIIGFGTEAMASAQATHTVTPSQATHKKKPVKHDRDDAAIRTHARLNQAVRDDTITASQKAAYRAELKQLHTERKTAVNKSSTKAERQTEHDKQKAELQAWASSNNFPLSKIAPHA